MKIALYILIIISLTSCVENDYVQFKSAQPEGVKESRSFNRKVKGEYVNCSNTEDKLIISDQLILNSQIFRFKIHRKDLDLDSSIVINRDNNGELKKLFKSHGYEIQFNGDTIMASKAIFDTVFQISDNQKLKEFKGSYFLNSRKGENHWSVNRLDVNKDTLFIGKITPSDTLLRFDFVAKNDEVNKSDSTTTIKYAMDPTKKEFKKLMRPNAFKNSECYCKEK